MDGIDNFMKNYFKRLITGDIVFMNHQSSETAPKSFEVECLIDKDQPGKALNSLTIKTVFTDNYHTSITIGGYQNGNYSNSIIGSYWIKTQDNIHKAMETCEEIRKKMRLGVDFLTAINDYRI